MFGFGKKKRAAEVEEAKTEEAVEATEETTEAEEIEAEGAEADAPEVIKYDRINGPHDIEEVTAEDLEDYVDLGALRIKLLDGMNLRLETDDATGAVIAATITRDGATLQVQAFAAPRTTGIWDDIRHDLTESVASQGGIVEIYAGVFGAEMLTRLPAVTPDGQPGERIARFVGVDGPRWFLRGVISGAAVLGDDKAAASVEEVFRTVVVDRGDDPRPPRELLPMTLPADLVVAAEEEPAVEEETENEHSKLRPMPRRGPEITEIG
ncbi:hypothetical protein HMPREF2779_01390 [Rothia sp. HMSC069C03]|uniref:DUF3710 domain-containing protein n=1 Tax=Rothia sp. HMSC069C03 TaxID=1739283 RepID=UPI0008C20748|nr:DUF3710 domain-containing protein [Rothia sp. HMSC069C03]OFL23546.1 hypothetical protein HMPREF2779_01390 [Rothia sp. HMSC069C03]